MTANRLRGEIEITLDGADYVLRPSYEAITAIEDQTGKALLELAVAADDGKMGLREMAVVVTECVRAYGRAEGRGDLAAWKADRVAELIYDAGVIAARPRVSLLLAMALTGGHKPGEAGAAGTTETTTESIPAAE
jgi:hypothetical protein